MQKVTDGGCPDAGTYRSKSQKLHLGQHGREEQAGVCTKTSNGASVLDDARNRGPNREVCLVAVCIFAPGTEELVTLVFVFFP